jgi:TolA-binding protein
MPQQMLLGPTMAETFSVTREGRGGREVFRDDLTRGQGRRRQLEEALADPVLQSQLSGIRDRIDRLNGEILTRQDETGRPPTRGQQQRLSDLESRWNLLYTGASRAQRELERRDEAARKAAAARAAKKAQQSGNVPAKKAAAKKAAAKKTPARKAAPQRTTPPPPNPQSSSGTGP